MSKRPDREQMAFALFLHESGQDEAFLRRIWEGHPAEHPVKLNYYGLADAVLSSLALKTETDQELQDRIEVLEKNLAYEVAQKIKLAEQLQAATATDLTLEQARWKMHAGIESRCSEEVAAEVKPVIDLVFSSLAIEPEAREVVCADEHPHGPHAWPHVPSYECPGAAREEQGQVEWGVAYRQNDGKLFVDEAVDYDDAVFRVANSSVYDMVVQRRVTAYTPVGAAPAPEAREEAGPALRIDDDGAHIYWADPVEGCWVAFRRVDCVGEEELPERRLPEPEAREETKLAEILARAEEVRQDDGWGIGGAWGDYGEVVVPLRILSYVIEGELDQKVASIDPGFALTYAEQVRRAETAEEKLAEACEEPSGTGRSS